MKTIATLIIMATALQLASAKNIAPKYDPIFGYSIVLPETIVKASKPDQDRLITMTNCDPIFGYAIVMPELIVNAARPVATVPVVGRAVTRCLFALTPEPMTVFATSEETTFTVPCGTKVSGDYHIAPGETVEDDITVTGGNAQIEGVLEGDLTVMGGTVLIDGEVGQDVAVFGGRMEVNGLILGDAAVMGGEITHRGTIEGDLVVIGGAVALDSGSVIEGDINLIGGDVDRNDNAVVKGEIKAIEINQLGKLMPGLSKLFKLGPKLHKVQYFTGAVTMASLIVVFILNLLALVIFPKAMAAIHQKIENELWVSAAIGFGLEIMFAPIILLFVVSIIGWPLIPAFCLAVAIAALFGFSAWSELIGERLVQGLNWHVSNRIGLFTLGWIATMLVLIISIFLWWAGGLGVLILVLGWTIVYIASTIGMGATVYALFKAIK